MSIGLSNGCWAWAQSSVSIRVERLKESNPNIAWLLYVAVIRKSTHAEKFIAGSFDRI